MTTNEELLAILTDLNTAAAELRVDLTDLRDRVAKLEEAQR